MESSHVIILGLGVVLILWLIASMYSVTVYRFHKPSCPHCISSEPEWKKFKYKCMFKLVNPVDVDMTTATSKQQALFQNMGGSTVPKVMAVYPNGYRTEYTGERTSDGYMHWLATNDAVV